jgi:glycine cleavage system H protein
MDLKSLKFAPTHEWVYIEGDVATVGISKFAVDQLTDLIMIELPAPGTRVAAGEVVEVNTQVTSNVSLLAEDSYDKGWLIKVKVDRPVDSSGLMDLDTYELKVAEEGH